MGVIQRSLDEYREEIDARLRARKVEPPEKVHPTFFLKRETSILERPILRKIYEAMQRYWSQSANSDPALAMYIYGPHAEGTFSEQRTNGQITGATHLDVAVLAYVSMERGKQLGNGLAEALHNQFPEIKYQLEDKSTMTMDKPVHGHVHLVKPYDRFYDLETRTWKTFGKTYSDYNKDFEWGVLGLKVD